MTDNPDEKRPQREGTEPSAGRLTRRQLLSKSALAGGGLLAASMIGGSIFQGSEAQAAAPPASAGPYPGDEAWRKAVADKVAGRTISIGFTPPAASEFYDEIEHGAFSQMRTYGDWF